eukprot:265587_1
MLTLVFMLISTQCFSQNIYNGPVTIDYFRETFNESINDLPTVICGQYQSNITTITNPVKYYRISITQKEKSFYESINITTCCAKVQESSCNNSSLDTIIYILYEKKNQINLITLSDDTDPTQCRITKKSLIKLKDFNQGNYIIAVGGYAKENGNYRLLMTCDKTSVNEAMSFHFVFLSIPLGLIIMYLLISRVWVKKKSVSFLNKSVAINAVKSDNKEEDSIDYGSLNDPQSNISNKTDIISQLLIECIAGLQDEDGLDIYQVLALRWNEVESRKAKHARPFQKFCCKKRFASIPRRYQSLIMAIIASVAQTIGLTVVVAELIQQHTGDGFCTSFPSTTNYFLSVLLSLMVTFIVIITFQNVQECALYKFITLHPEDIDRLRNNNCGISISIYWLYAGHFINGYACIVGAIGSYMIVFQAQQVLDLILNAIALLFMLEIDNMFTGPQDYHDCVKCLQKYRKAYKSESNIDVKYNSSSENINRNVKGICCASIMYGFASCVGIIVYVLGVTAPFLPLFCW